MPVDVTEWTDFTTGNDQVIASADLGATYTRPDNDVPINAALQLAFSQGGGLVTMPNCPLPTLNSIVIPGDKVGLVGEGFSTILQPVRTANYDVIRTPFPSSSGQPGFVVNYMYLRDFMIDMSAMYNAGSGTIAGQGNGIHTYGLRYSHIDNVFIQRSPNHAILLDGDLTNFSYDNILKDNIFDLCNSNIFAPTSEACNFEDNRFKWCGSATNALQPLFGTQDQIAMHLRPKSGYQYIAGNVFGHGGSMVNEAINIGNDGPCRIIGNRFDTVPYQAIRFDASNHMFIGNQLGNPSSVGSTFGIQIGRNNMTIIGNTFDATNGPVHWTFCIGEAGGPFTGNIIMGNQLINGTVGLISQNSASTNQIGKNTIFNPRGTQVIQPALGASGVAVQNTTGVDCMVLVGGGTVSETRIGGSTTGQLGGWFRVPANQTITITYSVAPTTFTWFGD